ncbi:MAG: biotin/lipoyl-containing protein, partial [Nocardioidaceae bacterium]
VSGADAVHPGYGFLSERAEFARAVTEAGLVFVGPSAATMAALGRKDHARVIAERAGVPVAPRVSLATNNRDASVMGDPYDAPMGVGDPSATGAWVQDSPAAYPLLVKAAAGGGGKGMRVVRGPAELPAALAAARRESAAAFGDDTLLLERYIENGRHVEVQIVGDHAGSVVHLLERDCSVQRRHQKVLEEAPAPTISPAVRRTLHESAVALAREAHYVNAGTVEFLVAGDDVYFLEMNTRLQVEHPVTEAVTGLDLVALQLRVAAGEPLGFGQDDVLGAGHAMEARVYAEDPYAGFLPQAGRAEVVRWPDPSRARVDTALESGSSVSTAYDPMLAKIIVHGPTREAARSALVAALDESAVVGLTTNLGFLRTLAASAPFGGAAVHTAWLDTDAAAQEVLRLPATPANAGHLAAWVLARVTARPSSPRSGSPAGAPDPFGTADGWRLAGPAAAIPIELRHRDQALSFTVDPTTGDVASPSGTVRVSLVDRVAGAVRLDVDGLVRDVAVAVDARLITVVLQGQPWVFERPDAFGPAGRGGPAEADVVAPMPGTVLAVAVTPGARVHEGQPLGVLEAMKMELVVAAPHAGTVSHVGVAAGDSVRLSQLLFTVDPPVPVGDLRPAGAPDGAE